MHDFLTASSITFACMTAIGFIVFTCAAGIDDRWSKTRAIYAFLSVWCAIATAVLAGVANVLLTP